MASCLAVERANLPESVAEGWRRVMYATVRRYEGVTDPGEMVRVLKDEGLVEDVLRPIPGFVSYSAMDAGGGTFMTITVYENQSNAEESNERVAEWVQQRDFGSLGPNA